MMTPYEKHIRINQLKRDYDRTWQDFDRWELRLDMSFNPFSHYTYHECTSMIWAINSELAHIESELRKLGVRPEDIRYG